MREHGGGGTEQVRTGGFLSIRGGRPLGGCVTVQGAKNSVLPILAASLLARGPVLLRRCPRLLDVEASVGILRALGCRAAWDGGDLALDTSSVTTHAVPARLMGLTRSSVLFLGAILSRLGCAACSLPGGDELGPRPIDLHLYGLSLLGAEIRERDGVLHCVSDGLRGRTIALPLPSVGATENLMLAACGASDTTVIANAAREPEIVDLQGFLNACGGEVHGAGTDTVTIRGGRALHGCAYAVMPDRIAAATCLCAAAGCGGDICLRGARAADLEAVLNVLRAAGCTLSPDDNGLRCTAPERPAAVGRVRTAPYPGFPTDAQAVTMAALLRARGVTVFEETLFADRFRHVEALRRMGANIQVEGRTAAVHGVLSLRGTTAACTDLRGGAALCVAALQAEGVSRVENLRHIDRGYEDLARDLRLLGADIRRVDAAEMQSAEYTESTTLTESGRVPPPDTEDGKEAEVLVWQDGAIPTADAAGSARASSICTACSPSR